MSRYTLLIACGAPKVTSYATLNELAAAIYRLNWSDYAPYVEQIAAGQLPFFLKYWSPTLSPERLVNIEAFDGMAVLDVAQLYRHGANLFRDYRRTRLEGWREGLPVPGAGRRFRYSRKYFRYPRTQQERRNNNLRLLDEGEPALRRARSSNRLPTAYSDIWRHTQRSWKSFGKRRKAWCR